MPKQYPFLSFRAGVWREIARRIQKDAPNASTVVELGAGFCDFINAFPASRKIAYDMNPAMAAHAQPGVEFRVGDATTLEGLEPNSVDLVFASNFLEHLRRDQLDRLLPRVHTVLRPRGKLILLQPNFRRCPEHYFDDETHVTVFSDESLAQFVVDHGFAIETIQPGFLPFSMKSRLPKAPILVRLYLASPFKPGAAQMYLVARKP